MNYPPDGGGGGGPTWKRRGVVGPRGRGRPAGTHAKGAEGGHVYEYKCSKYLIEHMWECSLVVKTMYLTLYVLGSNPCFYTFSEMNLGQVS
jgi:hypothetical protein